MKLFEPNRRNRDRSVLCQSVGVGRGKGRGRERDGWIALLTNIEGNNEKESKSVVKVSGKLFEIYYER